MFEITVRSRFAAAHYLRGYHGRCEALHGHNWTVEVGVRGAHLDAVGLLLDFKQLKEHVHAVLDEVDHTLLNDHPQFRTENPSSERIARWIHERVGARLGAPALEVSYVRVWESEDSSATYRA